MLANDPITTANFRLAVFFALAVTLATSVVFVFMYWQISSFDIDRVELILAHELDFALTQPMSDLKEMLDTREAADLRHVDYAGLFNREGEFLYGNIPDLPRGLVIDGKAHSASAIAVPVGGGRSEPGLLIGGRRPDGEIVVIGRTAYEAYAFRHFVVQALLVGLIPTIVLALTIGLLFSWRATRHLRLINNAITRIVKGELHERLPIDSSNDDIGYVASAVNFMLDEFIRLMEQMKRVGDNIAHDLRAPLTAARARLERALEFEPDGDLKATAHRTLADIDRVITTTTALLRIAEIESGRRRGNFKEIDLTDACRTVIDVFEPLAQEKEISISLEAPGSVNILGDSDLWIEAIANLVDNAIKFSAKEGRIQISADASDGNAVIRVADQGPGLTSEDRETVLTRSSTLHKMDCRNGTGFGLKIVTTIAELHGFSVLAKSNHPGTIFELRKLRSASVESKE